MATVIELAQEVRHRLVSKATGCLTVDYPDGTVSIYFWDGMVASERAEFISCLARNPVDFQFDAMKDRNPGQYAPGASLLIEAIEAIEPKFLVRVWESYADWRIVFRLDENLHNTFVRQHLNSNTEVLHRLMRLAVSGSARLERPTILISDEMETIEEAFAAGNWRKVLGVRQGSETSEIKQAYRKLARRFHPDRWITSADMRQRDRIERTFQHISRAYMELYRPRTPRPQLLVGTRPKKSLWEKVSDLVR
jgi:hypothetical protein